MTGRYLEGDWQQRSKRVLDRLFPERQLLLRTEGRVSYVRFTKTTQIGLMMALLLAGAWTTFTSVKYSLHEQILTSKDNDIAHARLAYHSLLNEVVEYQQKFTSINRDLEENHALMLRLVERNAALQQNLKSVENQLTSTERDRARVVAAREDLKSQLAGVQNEMRALTNRNLTLKDNLGTIETDLQTALVERNRALFDGTRMARQIKKLETRLEDLQETEIETVQRLTDHTMSHIDAMEKVIEMAGLKVEGLLTEFDVPAPGQGGPFIAATPDDLPGNRLKADLATLEAYLQQSTALQAIMGKLPLTAPLNSYYVTSGFGKRRDPINKRWASHYGLDLGSPFKAPVYVTAPGVVTYVGWKGKFGKMVEVDHGAGIVTRYAHLHKALAKKGDKLKFHDKIGLLGSTGRSTGVHLHYEVLFSGKAKNPMKFIQAGKYVFQE